MAGIKMLIKIYRVEELVPAKYIGPCVQCCTSRGIENYQVICWYSDAKLSEDGETFLVLYEEDDGQIKNNM